VHHFRSGERLVDARTTLDHLLRGLSDERLRQLIDFARFLAREDERRDWQELGRSQLSRAFGPDEPDYTVADIKPRT
jgi:hypothetical protein